MINISNLDPVKPSPVASPAPVAGDKGGSSLEEQALKGADGAKMAGISLSDHATGANGANGSPVGNQSSLGGMIEGKMALEIIDALLPAGVVILFALGKITVKKSDFQLTAKEKDTLTPLVQKCMDSIMINFNSPWTALAVTAIGIYGSKVAEHGVKAVLAKKDTEKAVKEANAVKQESVPDNAGEGSGNPEKGLKSWGREELLKVINKRRKGQQEATEWLNRNWEKLGGILDFKKAKELKMV